MKYRFRSLFSSILFASVFMHGVYAQDLIRPGYSERRMVDSQNTFTGNVAIEGVVKPGKYKGKKFNVFFIAPEKNDIVKKTYVTGKFRTGNTEEYYYDIEKPELLLSPAADESKQVMGSDPGSDHSVLVFDVDVRIDQMRIFNKAEKIPGAEINKIEKIFKAKFSADFPGSAYEDNLPYDTPFIAVRYATANWLLVDSYIFRDGVDYGYGYYVPGDFVEEQGKAGFGQYLYNRKTGDKIQIKMTHLIGDSPPVMFTANGTHYLSFYITIGKSYGQDELIELKNNKAKTIFSGSTTGS